MVLENLALLDASMRAAQCRSVRFTLRCAGGPWSIIYLNDTCPQELLILRTEPPRRWTRVPLLNGHAVDPFTLRPLLEPGTPSDAPLSADVRRFIEEFSFTLPRTIGDVEKIGPDLILQYSLDVEEPTRIYFAGWQPLDPASVRPNHPNLHKTRRAFGQDVYELCLHLQMGSVWTDEAAKRQPFKLPE